MCGQFWMRRPLASNTHELGLRGFGFTVIFKTAVELARSIVSWSCALPLTVDVYSSACWPKTEEREFLFWIFGESRQFPGVRSSLLCCWTWRCSWWVLRLRCWRRTGTRIWRQSKDNKRYDTFRLAEKLLPLFGQVWLLTAGPLKAKSVFSAELSKGSNGRRVLE